jgi:riboflavin kinase/FMN adenylyltransferase
MRVIRGIEGMRVRQRLCLAMGVFDGLHLGHQAIIAETVKMATPGGLPSVLTFEPHPDAVLSRRGAPPLLTTTEEKVAVLRRLGVRLAVIADFTPEFASTPARDFIAGILAARLKACCVVVGAGWRFGAAGEGTAKLLHRLAPRFDFRVKVVPQVRVAGKPVSSTRIRRLLSGGDVEAARECLGRLYQLGGEVVPGDGRGRRLGFPTANLRTPEGKLVPADGVYLAYARGDGPRATRGQGWRPALVSIGVRPSFERGGERRVEVHLLSALPGRPLLGRQLQVTLLARLRAERRFASAQALVSQMQRDRREALCRFAAASGAQALQPPGDML